MVEILVKYYLDLKLITDKQAGTISSDPLYRNVGYVRERAGCQLARTYNKYHMSVQFM